ncbi:MAG: class I SAM-dependent methyltransferase [Mesorhizobium sp.]|nr:class I SAM-dependent methyltransferase [Mesorhizobium sp.]
MTRLTRRIADTIAASGPIGVADYMALCLFDPLDGYYTTREPFGRDGDFVTSPEISQMFGEIVGVWLVSAWRTLGAPTRITIAEIGPGRGTLMRDALRTIGKIAPDLAAAAGIAMIETSPRLTAVQRATLGDAAARMAWHTGIDALPARPLLIVANELFDAVPIRQYVKTEGGWRERLVGLDETGGLAFVAGPGSVDIALLPPGASEAPAGGIAEIAPARTAMMDTIAARIAGQGGAGLFIDYGYAAPAVGDTLQALRAHEFDGVLAHPGEADLTAHVDFAALAAEAQRHGLETCLFSQGEFLLRMGLLERAGRLGAEASEAVRDRLRGDVERLAGPDAMGELFKALCVAPAGRLPAPFAASH